MHARIYYITRAVERRREKEGEKKTAQNKRSTWQSVCGGDSQDMKMLGHTYVVL